MYWLVVIAVVYGLESTVFVAGLSFLGVAITAIAGYIVKRRSSSGSVRQTTPDKLWDVADGMRRELTDALEKSYAREERLRDRITEQDQRLAQQDQRIAKQDRRILELETEVARLSRGIPG